MADSNVLLTSLTMSGISVAVINWIKGSKYFPWITKEKIWLLRIISIAAATASGVGINHVWNPVDHSILISGLTTANLLAFAWAITKQFTMNEMVFQGTKASSAPAVVAAVAPEEAIKSHLSTEKDPLKLGMGGAVIGVPQKPPVPPNAIR
jgi:hypothetical protein